MAWLVEFEKAVVADRIDRIQSNSIASPILKASAFTTGIMFLSMFYDLPA